MEGLLGGGGGDPFIIVSLSALLSRTQLAPPDVKSRAFYHPSENVCLSVLEAKTKNPSRKNNKMKNGSSAAMGWGG